MEQSNTNPENNNAVPAVVDNAGINEPLIPHRNGGSFFGAVVNLSTTIIGSGIMALPATMKLLGVVPGTFFILFFALLTYYSVEVLLQSDQADSYGAVMEEAWGDVGRIVLQIFVVINNIGVLIVCVIIIGDVLCGTSANGVHYTGLLDGWFGEHWWNGRLFVLLVTTLGVLTPLSWIKNIHSLRHTSAMAIILALAFFIIMVGIFVFKCFKGAIAMPRFFPDFTNLNSIATLFTVAPVLVTAYICHFNVHSIGQELQGDNQAPNRAQIRSVVKASLALCSVIYIATSLAGFLLFGDSTLDDVLSNFNSDLGVPSLLNDIVRVCYILHLILVFPVIFHPLRQNFDGLFITCFPPLDDDTRFRWITAGLMFLVFVGANYIPSIWEAFQFTGATAGACIGLAFPAVVAFKNRNREAPNNGKKLVTFIFIIALAVSADLVAVYIDAHAYFWNNTSPRAYAIFWKNAAPQ